MDKIGKLALFAALSAILAEDNILIDKSLIELNSRAWDVATKEQSAEDFYMKVKEYERKIEQGVELVTRKGERHT